MGLSLFTPTYLGTATPLITFKTLCPAYIYMPVICRLVLTYTARL